MKIRFEWDPDKAASNLEKHKVSFETAVRAFADPFALTEQDRIEGSERRWQTLGAVRPGKPTGKRGDVMKKQIVKHDMDLANLPPLTDAQKAELADLGARPDSEIDFSDIPPLTEDFWKNAVVGRFYKPTKTSTTVRIDSDVLAWLKARDINPESTPSCGAK